MKELNEWVSKYKVQKFHDNVTESDASSFSGKYFQVLLMNNWVQIKRKLPSTCLVSNDFLLSTDETQDSLSSVAACERGKALSWGGT